MTMEWGFSFFFVFFFVYSIWVRFGEKKPPSDDNLILDKILIFIFLTYNYFNICTRPINNKPLTKFSVNCSVPLSIPATYEAVVVA